MVREDMTVCTVSFILFGIHYSALRVYQVTGMHLAERTIAVVILTKTGKNSMKSDKIFERVCSLKGGLSVYFLQYVLTCLILSTAAFDSLGRP